MRQLLSYFLFIYLATSAIAQDSKEMVAETINKDKIAGHIYFLADDLLQGRETGTTENKIAASYIANQLRAAGAKPIPQTETYYQQVPMELVYPPRGFSLNINGTEVKAKIAMESGKLDQTVEGVYLGYGTEDDFKGVNVNKKIVLLKGGSAEDQGVRSSYMSRSAKSERAKAAGALAVIELIKADEGSWGYLQDNFSAARTQLAGQIDKNSRGFSYVWVQDEYGALALDFEQGKTAIKLMCSGQRTEPLSSQNVVGYIEGTDPELKNEFIIYSAHYDHIGVDDTKEGDGIYNGARDNAVGVTTVLSMAEHLGKHPTKRSALFILFTAEEKGLLGSKYYVENPIFPLDQMVFCFNSDNGGYNDTSIATIVGLGRTSAENNIKMAANAYQLTAKDDPAPDQGLFDRSDNVNFAKAGIPAPTYSLGFNAFDAEIMKYYHQPGDHADNLDYDYLEQFFRSYVLSGVLIGNDPVTPTWNAGDKYEAAAKKLYKN